LVRGCGVIPFRVFRWLLIPPEMTVISLLSKHTFFSPGGFLRAGCVVPPPFSFFLRLKKETCMFEDRVLPAAFPPLRPIALDGLPPWQKNGRSAVSTGPPRRCEPIFFHRSTVPCLRFFPLPFPSFFLVARPLK